MGHPATPAGGDEQAAARPVLGSFANVSSFVSEDLNVGFPVNTWEHPFGLPGAADAATSAHTRGPPTPRHSGLRSLTFVTALVFASALAVVFLITLCRQLNSKAATRRLSDQEDGHRSPRAIDVCDEELEEDTQQADEDPVEGPSGGPPESTSEGPLRGPPETPQRPTTPEAGASRKRGIDSSKQGGQKGAKKAKAAYANAASTAANRADKRGQRKRKPLLSLGRMETRQRSSNSRRRSSRWRRSR
ncbi:LOW QUALITY PROTEIN: uncharacterized protein EMH_0068810 [Eimeria mitis]|uniref:Transmembrane protein n=1 Tax=Eimeria mitis TaxID=44415 RepID=U6K1W8_9EIME|nr:LOW QUALITY PROTEIN: uncharacterized protein EMH_0068810 [Eimeria mitis]CDJ31689.1 hypothetical protein EMH_0068810 [Eimeria mitis]